MQNYFALNKRISALMCAFVLLLGVNIFLQFETAEELFNETFAAQELTSTATPSEVCGSRYQISAAIPQGATWNILPGIFASTSQFSKLKFAYVVLSFSKTELQLRTPTPIYIEFSYSNRDALAHSGLSPPLA